MIAPASWRSVALKRLVRRIEAGTSVNAFDVPAQAGEVGVLKTSCVYTGRFDARENKRVVEDEIDRVSCPVRGGTLIVSRMNTPDLVGSAGAVLEDAPQLFLPDRLWQVHLDGLSPRFAEYWCSTEMYRQQVRAAAAGTSASMQNLGQEDFLGFEVACPPLAVQTALVTLLDRETTRIDALIEKKTRFIELLREKRQAAITAAVTNGFEPDAPCRDTGIDWLGAIPATWVVRPLKYVARVQTGVAKGKDVAGRDIIQVPYLRVANVQDGFLDLDEVATIEIDAADLDRYLLQRGDVLMNEGGDFDKLGRGHIWGGEVDPCIHQNHVFAVRPTGVSSEWLNTYTGSAPAQFYFMGRSKQSTNLASISSSNLMELPVPVPSAPEQSVILERLAERLSAVDKLAETNRRSIELLRERRAALITAAVTGQIDVRSAAEPTDESEPAGALA